MATKKTQRSKAAKKVARPSRSPQTKTKAGAPTAPKPRGDEPQLFRINIEVADLDAAERFYSTLLGQTGRRRPGARVYFTCGAATLQVIDVSGEGAPHRAAKALYFTVNDLGAIFERARSLDCLSKERVHGMIAGEVAVRPWGERSFYADDPWQNPLCFVEAGTTYTG